MEMKWEREERRVKREEKTDETNKRKEYRWCDADNMFTALGARWKEGDGRGGGEVRWHRE